MARHRIGVDLGGTKIEIVVLDLDGAELLRRRVDTPRDYRASVETIAALVRDAEAQLGISASIGIGIPGVVSPVTGLVKNANSIALNGHPFDRDIGSRLKREVRVENDANCFALSEASDGAGAGCSVVFGVILGHRLRRRRRGGRQGGTRSQSRDWRVGAQPAALAASRGNSGTEVLVRPLELSGNLGRRAVPGARLRRRGCVRRDGDPGTRRRWRGAGARPHWIAMLIGWLGGWRR